MPKVVALLVAQIVRANYGYGYESAVWIMFIIYAGMDAYSKPVLRQRDSYSSACEIEVCIHINTLKPTQASWRARARTVS